MSTGVPLYLVSACGSAEEFVGAFRRYADRTGLFVPCATPLPAGRRGRIAVSLKDGGVMIEGEAEILQSSAKPTVLYGRPGMTIKFVEPDAASKQVIGELEKARLAMRPGPTQSKPRPANVPAEPRAVVPPVGGRIDAANALAECVVIGDPATLRDTAAGARGPSVPSIPAVGAVRSVPAIGAAPSIPSVATSRPNTPSKPPLRTKAASVPPVPRLVPMKKGEDPLLVTHRGTSAPPNPTPPTPMTAQMPYEPTAVGLVPQPPQKKTDPIAAVPTDEATSIGQGPPPRKPAERATSIGFPVQRTAFETQPLGLVPPAPVIPSGEKQRATPAPRGKGPPPRQRVATPVAPMPAMRAPAKSAPLILEEEKTDISETPAPPPHPGEPEAIEDKVVEQAPEPQTAARSGGMRASEILAAIPASGDWTMAPDESAPHILPTKDPQNPGDEQAQAPSGNWTMSLDREKGAWGDPQKVPEKETSGNPVGAVAGEKPLESHGDDKPTNIDEAKIEIDPTLMEPLKEMPVEEEPPAPPPLVPMPPMPPRLATMPPEYAFQSGTYPPAMIQPPFESGQYPPTYLAPPTSSRTLILMVAGGVLVVGAIIALVIIAMGGKRSPVRERVAEPPTQLAPPVPPPAGSAQVAMPATGSAHAPIDAGVPPKPAGACKVEVATTPAGADVFVDGSKVGVTPGAFELPCGTEAKLSIKKPTFVAADRSITPAADQPNKLVLKLSKMMASLKVTSVPAGATITASGKSLGVTPTTIKLPWGEPVTLTLTKPGFAPDVEKTTPRPGATIRVTLKKKK